MKFILFDREENYLRTLKNLTIANHTEEINGEDILELELIGNTDIKKGYRIAYKSKYGYWNEFIVREIEEDRTDTLITRLFCESSFYETIGDYIEDRRPYNTSAAIALSIALEPTRWQIGQVDDLGINTTNFYNISSKEAVQNVAKTWKGEIRTRVEVSGSKITNRYVDILARRGNDLGKRFTYSKDLDSIKRIIHRDDVITALYGFGKGEEVGDGYGRRINFAEINNGKSYVENNEAKEIWGRNNPDGSKSHVFGKVEFDDCEDTEELLELTQEKLEELSQPLITYEANVIDLKAYGLEHEGTELGDTVSVIDKEFKPALRLKARVVRIVRDLLQDENIITLGNFMPDILDDLNEYEGYINNFRGKEGVWDRSNIIGQNGTIDAQHLENLISELNTKMSSAGGYHHISEDGKGDMWTDKPSLEESTMAIQILGGAFRIAGSKLPNGDFDFRTFGTGEGFIADHIVAGTLDAAIVDVVNLIADNVRTGRLSGKNVFFDLDEGILEVFDNQNRQRVQLGNYANGKYGLLLKDSSGNKTILDEDGILQSWQEGRTDNIASNNPLRLYVYIPENTRSIYQAVLRIKREYFRSYSQATQSGGSTVVSSQSGGSTTTTSGSGGSTTTTSSGSGDVKDNTGSGINIQWADPMPHTYNPTDTAGNPKPDVPNHVHRFMRIHSHEHDLQLGPHTHSVSIGSHTHSVSIGNHSHNVSIPSHSHGITHGIYENASYSSNIRVGINGTIRTAAISGGTYINEDRDDLKIGGYLEVGQWNEIEISGTGLGRIDATVFIQALMNA